MEEKKVEAQSTTVAPVTEVQQTVNSFKNSANAAIVSPDHLYVRDNEGTIIGLLKKGDIVEKIGTPNEKGFVKVNCNMYSFVYSKSEKYVQSTFLEDKVVNK